MNAKYVTPMLVLAVAVLAIALFIRGGEVITALIINTTNSSYATVNITAGVPVMEAVKCYDANDNPSTINLMGGGQRYVKCNTTIADVNGAYDMATFLGQISTSGAGACTASNRNCYANTSCENTTLNATAFKVQCSYLLWYNSANTSQSGTWTGNITVVTLSGVQASGSGIIGTAELLALGVDSTLAFGSRAANTNDSTISTSYSLKLYNYGNVEIDFQVNGSTMQCGSGSISAEYMHVNLTNGDTYSNALPLTSTLQNSAYIKNYFNLTANSTGTTETPLPPNKATYWGIGIPPAVSGNCQGTIWFAAVVS